MTTHRNIGGSLLPSSDRFVLTPQSGVNGTLAVKALPELDTHGLFFTRTGEDDEQLLAMHPNGYSCKELATRILQAWENDVSAPRAIAQFDYILACGGLGCSRTSLLLVIGSDHPAI